MKAEAVNPNPRRGGRPSRAEAARLDAAVREQALKSFLEHGYEGTSMEAVARAAGTTKASVYARFPSKEAMFAGVFAWAMERPDWAGTALEGTLAQTDLKQADLEQALTAIAEAALARALDPVMRALSKIAVTEGARFPDLARRADSVYWPHRDLVVDVLRQHSAAGEIEVEEPEVLAEHFLAMTASAPARLASFGIVRAPEVQARYTRVAVTLLVQALRPPQTAPSPPQAGR